MRGELKFAFYDGDLMGLPTDENHQVFRWKGEGKVIFSASQRGNAISAHFASDTKGLRHVRMACNDFVQFCFDVFPWCEMIFAHVGKSSVERLIQKIGFKRFMQTDRGVIYIKVKS